MRNKEERSLVLVSKKGKMAMKIIIVGTNHAGIAAANTLLENTDHELVLIDKNSNISYLGAGTALWVSGEVEDYEGLFYTDPSEMASKGARILMETAIERIDFEEKVVYGENSAGEKIEESYDKLILATGSNPIEPNLPGKEAEGIHFLKLFQDGQAVQADLDNPDVKRVGVIGAGYIGVEIAEALKRRGKEVLLFDAEPTSLSTYYDEGFSKLMDENLAANGLELHFAELAEEYVVGEDGRVDGIVTNKDTYQVDMVVNAIGFRPNSELGKDHLELFVNGAYLVDKHQQTSDPDVYAVGDCATIHSNALDKTSYIALASNAVRTGIVGGQNAGGKIVEGIGAQGSNAISIFDLNLVSTGYSVKSAEKFGLDVAYVDHHDLQRAACMKENDDVQIRIVYEKGSRRIVGAQLASHIDVSGTIHMFSLAIQERVTIDSMKLLDTFYLPHFNQPYNYITSAAMKAE